MLKELFNRQLQDEMTDFFLNKLAPKGIIHKCPKNKILEPRPDNVYIVVKGMVIQELFSEDGRQTTLFMLSPGTIFGEMEYFDGNETCALSTVMTKDTEISVLSRKVLESELAYNPRLYNYFMHSIIRKYRILMLKLADDNFNDFRGKLASTLIRFAVMEEGDAFNGARIRNVQSLTNFAKYLSCSRSTLSMAMNKLKDEGIIDMVKGDIIIRDKDKLMEFINFIW